jgi:hypothetical protein
LILHKSYRFNLLKTALVLFVAFFCFNIKVKAQEINYKAYSLYIYNFMKYIEWPENNSQGDFIILVLGKSGIEKELRNMALQKKIKGRNIIVKSITTTDEIKECHLLYLSEQKSSLIKDLNARFKNKDFLIVGEKDGLAYKGASLSFATLDNDELSFDINKKNITQHNLKISESLIKLGSVVIE